MRESVGVSRFWEPLWRLYANAPSAAFCRTPELEYASGLDVQGSVLDHCCGDGAFAAQAWSGRMLSAGCDLSVTALEAARKRGIYRRVDHCDASQSLPYEDGAFDLVFNNSALEHILDLDGALAHVARVLKPGGTFAFNVLNHRYFEWWPLDDQSKKGYREWQPFFHALTLAEWKERLARVGLQIVSVEGYFDKDSARVMAWLDCEFSGMFLAHRRSWLVLSYLYLPFVRWYWRRRLSALTWKTEPDAGAGYFIKATRNVT